LGSTHEFGISLRRYQPNEVQSWHAHRDAHLILTARGGFTEHWLRRSYDCTRTTALLRPAGERHANRYRADGSLCVVVRLDSEWIPMLEGAQLAAGCYGSPELSPLVTRLYVELGHVDSVTPMAVQSLLLDIMVRLSPARLHARERRTPLWIRSTMDLLRSHLDNPPGVQEAARLVGVHPAHLSRTFRRVTGLTMSGYVRRERIAVASARLRRSEDSITAIALEAGFYDQAHFSRTFRQALGMSPREFRQAHRER
jgi:AraC family transcriptional regulator